MPIAPFPFWPTTPWGFGPPSGTAADYATAQGWWNGVAATPPGTPPAPPAAPPGFAFDPSMFPDSIVMTPPDAPSGPHNAASPRYTGAPTYSGVNNAYVEATSTEAARQEGHDVPEGRTLFNVFTPADPGAVVHSRVAWAGVLLEAIAPARKQAQGALWRTWCVDVA